MKYKITFALCLLALVANTKTFAFDGRVFPPNEKPNDNRLEKPVTLRDYHPFRPVPDIKNWKERASQISARTKVAAGLLPEPDKTPLRTVRSEKRIKDGFAIENIYFESFPGHFVTGTLFSPAGESLKLAARNGKRPVVLCPHGHWKNGRFYDAGEGNAKGQIAQGGERFVNAARNPIVARCVQLARMGCLAFSYDMLGNADSLQFVEHRRGPRPKMTSEKPGEWGFVSPAAILRLQTNFGLQTWNSIRALDMMLEHPEADGDRVLVTGASGGGTQTLILAAVDSRVDASFPCVMPSTAMQGGCTCENACYLRIGQGNIDLAAASAPNPLGMTAADDWTIELETKGHPDLLDLYRRLKAPNAYQSHFDIHFKHNYNHVSRTHMYQFVNRHFKIGLPAPVLESDFAFLNSEDLSVWPKDGSRPDNYLTGAKHEKELNRIWAEDGAAKVSAALKSGNLDGLRSGWDVILRRDLSDVGDVEFELADKAQLTGMVALAGVIRHPAEKEELPALFYYPEKWNGSVTILASAAGKGGLYAGDPSTPTDKVKELLAEGQCVAGVDLFGQGEFLDPGETRFGNQAVTYSGKKELAPDSWQRSPVYYYGYNDSIFVRRVHDLLTTVKMIQTHPKWEVKSIRLECVGNRGIGAAVLAAAGRSGGAVKSVAAPLGDFAFEKLDDWWGEHFVPGAVRFGDVTALIRLAEEAGAAVRKE